jgi:hypothetical protein
MLAPDQEEVFPGNEAINRLCKEVIGAGKILADGLLVGAMLGARYPIAVQWAIA